MQEPHCGRLERNERADDGGVTNQHLDADDRSGAGAEHDCGAIADVLDQAPDIVRVGFQPTIGAVRRGQPAS